jgi:phosphoserine phosphatase RsbU/P
VTWNDAQDYVGAVSGQIASTTSLVRLSLTAPQSGVKLRWTAAHFDFEQTTMRRLTTVPRPVLLALAILFGAATTAYSVVWMVHVHYIVGLGTDLRWAAAASHGAEVHDVESESSAWQVGLRSGDRIIAVNGERLDNPSPFYGYPFYKAVMLGRKGDVVQLSILRPGEVGELTLRPTLIAYSSPSGLRGLALKAMNFYPLFFLVVGMLVLSLRLEDRNAWLLALLFAGFIGGAPLFEGSISPHLRSWAACYKTTFGTMVPGIFCYFFLTFPTPSPIDRRLPRLKVVLLSVALAYSICLGLACLIGGGLSPDYSMFGWVSRKPLAWPLMLYTLGLYGLGFASLAWNSVRPTTAVARRKTRVIVWGMLAGFGPLFVMFAASFLTNFPIWEVPFWMLALGVISLSLMPLSFAYAVVKHRVLEIPVLLKRSARYVLVQRGYFVLLFVTAATTIALFTHTISRFFPAGTNIGLAVSAVFGIVLVWVSAPMVKRGTEQIDRAFFRSAYDARLILQDLAAKTRAVADRHELAKLLEIQIEGALHPKSLACYLEGRDGNLVAERGSVPRPQFPFRFGAVFIPRDLDTIPATLPLLTEIAQHGKAWDVPHGPEAAGDLGPLAPECLVPILGRNSRLFGLLVLGQRLSEESYSNEDKRLLDSVASQAGITLENIDLAEKMAERMEAERRVAMEIDIARRVQARLFPQNLPPLETLEYVGGCVQARQVGGDYYDFLDMGPGVVGIVLADISGKGMSGALLMANLQANLRSQYAVALDDLPRLLQSVNRLFYENTADESYATMFFGVYENASRNLRFANCGHIAPMILRTDGSIQRLTSTTTVVGLFLKWESPIEEETLHPGDLLVICTDGVTEAPNPQAEEYGEVRLAELIRENRYSPVNELLAAVQASVQEFSGATQADDITVIVARCH